MSDTSHLYGCTFGDCDEVAVTRLEHWRGTWGWVEMGDFCLAHVVRVEAEAAAESDVVDTRRTPMT